MSPAQYLIKITEIWDTPISSDIHLNLGIPIYNLNKLKVYNMYLPNLRLRIRLRNLYFTWITYSITC